MQTSKLKMFGQLYLRDMRELAGEIVLVLAVIIILDGLCFFRCASAGAVIAPAFMTLGLAAFLPMISSFKLLKREWSGNTIYLIMSLPVSGTMVLGSKLAALLTQYIIGTLAAGITGLYLLIQMVPPFKAVMLNQPVLITRAEILFGFSLLFLALLIATSFLSQLVGSLVPRFAKLTTVIMFVLVLYLMGHLVDNYSMLILEHYSSVVLPSYWAALGMAALVFIVMAGSVYLYDHRIEI